MRARALRAPVFLGSLPRQTGRCAPPPPIAASLLFIRPQKIFTIYRTWAAYVKDFFLSTEAMEHEVPCPCPRPAHRSFADSSGNIFGVKLCFLYFNCLLYDRHAYLCYIHIRHSEGFFEGAKPYLIHWGAKIINIMSPKFPETKWSLQARTRAARGVHLSTGPKRL